MQTQSRRERGGHGHVREPGQLDEWDAPLRERRGRESQEDWVYFLRLLFKNFTFTAKAVAAAYMTGILPIVRYGTQSALSDFREYTFLRPYAYAPYVGFTQGEVEALAARPGMDMAELRRWYDGYELPWLDPAAGVRAKIRCYAPFSVMSACENGCVGPYWTDSETFKSLRLYRKPLSNAQGFFASLGADGSCECAERLVARLPHTWHPWYLGLFPEREGAGVRVGAFVSKGRQAAYANDPRTLADDLSQVGFTALDDTMLTRISAMAALPFVLELQLDATEDGTGDTLGADLTLGLASAKSVRSAFTVNGHARLACKFLESWGLADSRWQRIPDASISNVVPLGLEGDRTSLFMGSIPGFVKAKWTKTRPQPAKAYFKCAARPVDVLTSPPCKR